MQLYISGYHLEAVWTGLCDVVTNNIVRIKKLLHILLGHPDSSHSSSNIGGALQHKLSLEAAHDDDDDDRMADNGVIREVGVSTAFYMDNILAAAEAMMNMMNKCSESDQ